MKLWGGRFRKETDDLVNDFNSSIQFDCRLYREDIQGSLAHAAMLADCGIISREDEAAIRAGLEGILADIEAGKVEFTADNEDIHMNVEALLTERIGAAGKRLHTARSRTIRWPWICGCTSAVRSGRSWTRSWTSRRPSWPRPRSTRTRDARLHPPPAGPAHLLRPAPAGLRRHAPPGRGAAPGLPGADERVPPGQRGPGGDHLPHRPVGDRQGAGLYSAHGQQLRRSQRPGTMPSSSSQPSPC